MVDMVANVSSKAPVIAAVLKQVHNRHGRVGESTMYRACPIADHAYLIKSTTRD